MSVANKESSPGSSLAPERQTAGRGIRVQDICLISIVSAWIGPLQAEHSRHPTPENTITLAFVPASVDMCLQNGYNAANTWQVISFTWENSYLQKFVAGTGVQVRLISDKDTKGMEKYTQSPEENEHIEPEDETVKVKFEVYGHEMIEKIVRASGNSGRIYIPPDWVGHRVKIIKVD